MRLYSLFIYLNYMIYNIQGCKVIIEIIEVIFMVLRIKSFWDNIFFLVLPFLNAILNIYVNNMILNLAQSKEMVNNDVMKNIIIKCIYDYMSSILLHKLIFNKTRTLRHELILKLNMSKIKCFVPIPGNDQKKFKDMHEDNYKLSEFLVAIQLLWVCVISFVISIANIKNINGIPIQLIFIILCFSIFCIMVYMTDSSLYEKTKPNATTITSFDDSDLVKLKLATGCKIDVLHEQIKRNKQSRQYEIQQYFICIINFSITFISFYTNNISMIYTFGNIIWMLGTLADNIKSLYYRDYIKDFLTLCFDFEKHSYNKYNANNEFNIDNFNSIIFINASFGYYNHSLTLNNYYVKIHNLSFRFDCGNFYYLEAPNGIGKSTLLKMFTSKLFSGDMYFDYINRNNVSFKDLYKQIFHIVQASEYTPKFSLEEVQSFKGRDLWLEERLKLEELLNKDSVEISGGQKKRVYIYMALTSQCKALLLDEILSELSTEDTPDVPEGGGWLSRVLNTIIEWEGIKSKIIVLVGHGLLNLIPERENIHKIKIINKNRNTIIEKSI